MALTGSALARALPLVPRGLVSRVSARYIAGPALADALRVVRALNGRGISATVDLLGEQAGSLAEAERHAAEYHQALAAIARQRLDANVSLKPTAFGLQLDAARCAVLIGELERDAAERGSFVRVEMEQLAAVPSTIDLYERLREMGHRALGVVLQLRLRRTAADAQRLRALQADVRLCKGIFPAGPADELPDAEAIRRSYVDVAASLLDGGCRACFATHDGELLRACAALVTERGLPAAAYEFQMLLGVRPELHEGLLAAGHRLRVYVPYGRRGHEYALRRLQENPQIAGHVARQALGALGRRGGPQAGSV